MEQREIVLNKISEKEKEWNHQVKYLQSVVLGLEADKFIRLQKYVKHLEQKLSSIQKNTNQLKTANLGVWEKNGDKILSCWEELVHNVDYVISSYMRIIKP